MPWTLHRHTHSCTVNIQYTHIHEKVASISNCWSVKEKWQDKTLVYGNREPGVCKINTQNAYSIYTYNSGFIIIVIKCLMTSGNPIENHKYAQNLAYFVKNKFNWIETICNWFYQNGARWVKRSHLCVIMDRGWIRVVFTILNNMLDYCVSPIRIYQYSFGKNTFKGGFIQAADSGAFATCTALGNYDLT